MELRSLDGTVTLEGNLVAFDGAYYQLDSAYGRLTVAAEGVSCAGPGCPDLSSFVAEARIAGEATVAEGLLPALLAGFAQDRGMALAGPETTGEGLVYALTRRDGSTAARVVVAPGTSDSGFLALLNGDTDLALTLRAPTEAERRADRAGAPDDPPLIRRVRVIGLDALVPVVAPQNPVDALSQAELAAIYTGEIDNWQALGGPDAPVALHLLEPELGLAQTFATAVLGGAPREPAAGITTHASALALATAVARDAYALGVTAQSARGTTRSLPLAGACGFSQGADPNAVKAEDYPLTAPVYLYLAPRRLPQLVRDFLAWTETEAAERVVAEAGYVNQSLTRTPLALQGTRLANAVAAAGEEVPLAELQRLVETLGHAERLSATFRFADGSVDLDAQSRASVARLAAAIEQGAFDGRRLVFVGFSDGGGRAEVNLRLSLRRAETVRAAVLAAAEAADPDRVTLDVDAFGEAMPMACDDSDWGRAVNRRVEVWLD
ncbi:phosphate ABC transporter substrate-binding/OmpA family protein [Roseicyclus persicicus]|uniref:phosphate ABC transporter substrate-binding/OmpA family protein n=1 Tax=Roseicyclus persicicus TaxID=2650661 RepID=UPI0030846483